MSSPARKPGWKKILRICIISGVHGQLVQLLASVRSPKQEFSSHISERFRTREPNVNLNCLSRYTYFFSWLETWQNKVIMHFLSKLAPLSFKLKAIAIANSSLSFSRTWSRAWFYPKFSLQSFFFVFCSSVMLIGLVLALQHLIKCCNAANCCQGSCTFSETQFKDFQGSFRSFSRTLALESKDLLQ